MPMLPVLSKRRYSDALKTMEASLSRLLSFCGAHFFRVVTSAGSPEAL